MDSAFSSRPAPTSPPALSAALYDLIAARRDVRSEFSGEPLDDATLHRLISAAHAAPSVGLSQPWDFVVVRDRATREAFRAHVQHERTVFADQLVGERAQRFGKLKIEGILDSSVGLVVTCDLDRGAPAILGGHAIADTVLYSVCLAIQNFWLAATAEGIGVGWVSFYRENVLRELLGIPERVRPVAWLCVGPVTKFQRVPDLERLRWRSRIPVDRVVHAERFGRLQWPPSTDLAELREAVRSAVPDTEAASIARKRQDRLTKPPGSLGRLEELSVWLSGARGRCPPGRLQRPRVVVFAGDHGVARAGVSAYPAEVTAQMVRAIQDGVAAAAVLAAEVGASVRVEDLAVDADTDPRSSRFKVRRGSGRIDQEDALTRAEAERALAAGAAIASDEIAGGADLLIAGEVGIGNTTPAAALIAALTGADAAQVTGPGTGLDPAGLARKVEVVRAAVTRTESISDPIDLIAALGGADLAAVAGFLLGAAAGRTPVVLDGVIVGAAALVAHAFAPEAARWWLAGHRSSEPAHELVLRHLGLVPVLDLGMHLGEGSGALVAVPVLRAAAALLENMVTFEEAGVSDRPDE